MSSFHFTNVVVSFYKCRRFILQMLSFHFTNVVFFLLSHPLEDFPEEESAHDDWAPDDEEPGDEGLWGAAVLSTLSYVRHTASHLRY